MLLNDISTTPVSRSSEQDPRQPSRLPGDKRLHLPVIAVDLSGAFDVNLLAIQGQRNGGRA